jgi:hypothetical protein
MIDVSTGRHSLSQKANSLLGLESSLSGWIHLSQISLTSLHTDWHCHIKTLLLTQRIWQSTYLQREREREREIERDVAYNKGKGSWILGQVIEFDFNTPDLNAMVEFLSTKMSLGHVWVTTQLMSIIGELCTLSDGLLMCIKCLFWTSPWHAHSFAVILYIEYITVQLSQLQNPGWNLNVCKTGNLQEIVSLYVTTVCYS